MLFGKVIFIKKSGGDGSKYPVKEKNVLIGNSEQCSIRIHNSQVAPQHCQLIADDKGQVRLRNFSEVTYLNGKLLNQDVTLCHGDIFKIGDRLARWEYLPSSKYYRQLLSPSGRLVAVVMPQQRSQVSVATPGTSAGQISPRSTKRRNSEKVILEGGSAKKILKTSNENKMPNGVKTMTKIISGRHSFHTAKMLFSPKIKMRKSTSCIHSSETPVLSTEKKTKRNSLLGKVNPASPPLVRRSGPRKSTPIKQTAILKPSKSVRNSSLVKNLNTIEESPSNENNDTKRLTRSLSKSPNAQKNFSEISITPKKKNSSVKAKLINSESKLNSQKNMHLKKLSQVKRLSLGTKYEETLKKSPLKKENRRKKSASTFNMVSKSGKSTNNVKSENLDLNSVTKISSTEVKFNRNSPKKIQTLTSETHIFSSSKIKKPEILPKRTSTRALSPKQSVTSPSKKIVKKSTSTSVEKKKLKGTRRKRSSLITFAERAPKNLKISSPSKLDKNKKAALLVLGKANRKHSLSQNVKVLLKQKIIKKAIKQSTTAPGKKDLKVEQFLSKREKKKKRNSVNQKKKNSTEVLQGKKYFNKGISALETKESNSRLSDTKKIQLFEEISKEVKNSNSTLSPSEAVSVKETTPRSLKTKLSETSSEFSKKSRSTNTYNATMNDSFNIFTKSPEIYIFNSSRRCSKRLSSKNDVSKPDFMELSPTALGLMPKNIEIFKTPKQIKRRRSISLVTPKNSCLNGIVKFPSTSKLGHKKSVRFSSKDLFDNSKNFEETSQSTPFGFENIDSPNITLEMFVSPLSQKTIEKCSNSSKKREHAESLLRTNSVIHCSASKSPKTTKSQSKSIKCARKLLQSPQSKATPKNIFSPTQSSLQTKKINKSWDLLNLSKTPKTTSPKLKNILQSPTPIKNRNSNKKIEKPLKSPQKSNNDGSGVRIATSENIMSPKNNPNESSDLSRVSQLTKASNNRKSLRSSLNNSPLNLNDAKITTHEFSDTKDVSQYSRTIELKKSPANNVVNTDTRRVSKGQKENKSPKNNLNDFAKVKSCRMQKNPKNELNDLRGVKELFSQKTRKSPKNDLTDIAGVKRLLRTPRENKSPKNDLSDVAGVKQLLKTPRLQKSPKNDLTDIAGVKRLLRTPKENKSPKNDLTDIAGVKQLFRTPKENKSPKNDLTDIAGVKQLLKTPRLQKSPKNELNDLRGVKELFSQKTRKNPKNDLTDIAGVKRLLRTPRENKSPKNDLSDVAGVKQLFKTPREQKSPKNDLSDPTGVKQLMRTPHLPKSPKNDLSDVEGVKELLKSPWQQKSPKNNLQGSEENVGELFNTFQCQSSLTEGTEIKQLLIVKNTLKVSSSKNKTQSTARRFPISDYRDIKGRRTIGSTSNNYSTNTTEMVQIFPKNKPTRDLNISLTGIAELFDCQPFTPEIEKSEDNVRFTRKKVVKSIPAEKKISIALKSEITKKRGRPRERAASPNLRKSVRKKKEISMDNKTGEKKRRIDKTLATESFISNKKVDESRRKRKLKFETLDSTGGSKKPVKIGSRSVSANSEPSPPKLRRKHSEVVSANVTEEKTKKVSIRKKSTSMPKKKVSTKRIGTAERSKELAKKTLPEVQSEISSKSTQKVQIKRSQTRKKRESAKSSEKSKSPIKTRSAAKVKAAQKETKEKVQTKKTVKTKTAKSISPKKTKSPIATRSLRKK